jgi:hypothetical protein
MEWEFTPPDGPWRNGVTRRAHGYRKSERCACFFLVSGIPRNSRPVKNNMAAKFDAEEVLRLVLDDDEVDRESDQEEEEGNLSETDNVEVEMEKLERLIDSFDGGGGFNSELFSENAKKALLPILCQSFARLQLTGNKEKGM